MSPPFDDDGYVAVFGGQNRSPAQIDYVAYSTAVDLHLQWPFLAEDGAFIAPAKLDINATQPGLKIFMPDASIVSVGQDCLVRNVGSNAFTLVDALGNTIVNITSGLQWFVWVVDNDTVAGQWARTQFAAGASNAVAGALAGAGLRANITKLDQDLVTTPLLGNHTISVGDRARVIQNNGGVVTYAVDDAGVLGNGFFSYIVNSGSGTLTIDPFGTQTIDGASSKTLAPGENLILFSDGANLITLGYGRSLVNTVTGTSISLAPGGTTMLSSVQVAAQVQNWTGTLTSNAIVDYGGGVGYWFVWNNTSGAFTTTARNDALDPGVVVPQGNFSILRSDGANMHIAFSDAGGTVTEVRTQAGELVGGPITTDGTIGLADTAVTPGTYGLAGSPGATTTAPQIGILTIDQKGRETAASSYTLGTSANFNAGTNPGEIPVIAADGNLPPQLGGVPTGAIFDFMLNTLPAGHIWAAGTIGNVGSAATNRANADCHALFVGIWNSFPNTTAPVTPGGRGADAESDWLALKAISIGDFRGMTRVGRDAMGPFAARGLITGASATPNGTTMGATGGAQLQSSGVSVSVSGGVSVTVSVGVSGTLGGSITSAGAGGIAGGGGITAAQIGDSVSVSGSLAGSGSGGGSFSGGGSGSTGTWVNMPPFTLVNVIVKL